VEVTLEITQFCPFECDYCSSNASVNGKHLPYETIRKFLLSQKPNNITRINVSGGEPVAHPQFYDILQLCYTYTEDVRIYTNMIRHILFNSDIIDEVKTEANVCVVAGRTVFIPENVDTVHLLKLVHQGRAKNLPKTNIIVSNNFKGDCNHNCQNCQNILLQADGKTVDSPCKKEYNK